MYILANFAIGALTHPLEQLHIPFPYGWFVPFCVKPCIEKEKAKIGILLSTRKNAQEGGGGTAPAPPKGLGTPL